MEYYTIFLLTILVVVQLIDLYLKHHRLTSFPANRTSEVIALLDCGLRNDAIALVRHITFWSHREAAFFVDSLDKHV